MENIMETKHWKLPYQTGWVYADRSEDTPVVSLTLINRDDGTRHTLTTFGAEHIRHLADIFTAAANFVEGAES